ncbi:ABC transporter substrate-binding protein (plasmid) [Streptomyces sp. BI20]|uniref:ABC transporter substrate-binding protein n=1 Tax=Streptomyces sp. BI20 TaxID=3403460 RepID=UPI003C7266E1
MTRPRTTRTRSATALALLLTLTATSACATTDGTDGPGTGGAGQLTYWSMWTSTEPQAEVLREAIDGFTAQTGIKVHVEWQGRKVLDKVGPALLTGAAPDLVDQSYDRLLPALASNGQARDVTGVLDRDTGEGRKVRDVIPADLLKVVPRGKDGTPWLIPYELVTVSLFTNGADPLATPRPSTWEEFLAGCERAKAAGTACVGTDGDAPWATVYWYDHLVNRAGGSLPRFAADPSGKGWDAPEALDAARRVEQLVKGGYLVKGYDATKYPTQQNNWATGKSLYYLMGSWLPGETATFTAKDFKTRSIDFPATAPQNPGAGPRDPRAATAVIPFGFAIPKKAAHPEAAERFAAWFLAKDRLKGIAERTGNTTPRQDIPAPAALADAAASVRNSGVRLPLDGLDPDYQAKVLEPAFTDLWLGKTTAPRFIDAMRTGTAAYRKATGR